MRDQAEVSRQPPVPRPCARCGRPRRIKGRGLCSTCWKDARADYPRRQERRPWTQAEVDWLRAHYRVHGPRECARRLQRSRTAITLQALRRGLTRPRRCGEGTERAVRRLHARGLSDGEAARRLGYQSGEAFRYWRRKLGLAANPFQERLRAAGRQAARRTTRSLGVQHLVEVRRQVQAIACARRGWPQARTPGEADVLDALSAGPRNCRALVEARGLRWGPGNYRNARGVLHRLIDRGLVVARRQTGPRGAWVEYALAPGVRRTGEPERSPAPGDFQPRTPRTPRTFRATLGGRP